MFGGVDFIFLVYENTKPCESMELFYKKNNLAWIFCLLIVVITETEVCNSASKNEHIAYLVFVTEGHIYFII